MAQALKIDVVGMEEAKASIRGAGKAGYKALARSINRSANHTKSQVSKKAREKTTVKAGYAKKGITIPFRATARSLSSRVVISGKRIPLIGYSVRQTKKWVSGRIYKADPLILRPRAFIATMPYSGHKGVFWRRKRSTGPGRQGNVWQGDMQMFFRMLHNAKQRYPSWDRDLVVRLGITELSGPALPDLIKDPRVWKALAKDVDERLLKELDTNLAYYLKQMQ